MKVAVGADHAGFALKNTLADRIRGHGHEVADLGAHEYAPGDDYPDFSIAVAEAVAQGRADRGVIVCGSGVGASVAANKVRGARAALCHDTYSARQGVEHDDLNVLCVGGRVIGDALAAEVLDAFLGATFSGEERHERRLQKILDAERRNFPG
jgi:ribose 5-phosphate isomerase B